MAESEKFTRPVRRQLDDLGISGGCARFVESLWNAPGWRALARLEAGTRSVGAIVCDPGDCAGEGKPSGCWSV